MEESSGSPSGPLRLQVVRTREEKSSGAWVAGRNRTGSVHWAGLHVHVLGVCLKGRKLSAEVEGRQAKPGAARSLPPFSLPPASQPASRPASQSVDQSVSQPASQSAADPAARTRREKPKSAEKRARCVLAPASPPSKPPSRRPVTRRARARPLPLPGKPPPFATRPSSLPLPLPRAAPHGLRAAEALPSARTTLRSLGRALTCQARPPAVYPAARRLLQAPTHCAKPVAAAAPAGTEASLQTPTLGPLPRKHLPLPLVLSAK